jgi:hypothetical protein
MSQQSRKTCVTESGNGVHRSKQPNSRRARCGDDGDHEVLRGEFIAGSNQEILTHRAGRTWRTWSEQRLDELIGARRGVPTQDHALDLRRDLEQELELLAG